MFADPESFHEYMFVAQLRKDSGSDRDGQHPMRLNSGPLQERYTREVDTRVAADLASGLGKPTKEEHLVARLSLLPDRSEDEASIAAALNEALRWGRPMEGAKLQQERVAVLHRLGSAGDIDKWDAQDLLARLYRSHTYREIRALADPERDLPATMLPIDDAARGAAALGYAKSAQVASDVLTNFSWTPHMRQHGPEIESPSMSDGLARLIRRGKDQYGGKTLLYQRSLIRTHAPICACRGHDLPWLVDDVVPGLAAQRDDVFVGFEDPRQPVVAHELPDILHRVQLAIAAEDGDVVGDRQRASSANRLIGSAPHGHRDRGGTDLDEVRRHGVGVAPGHDQPGAFPLRKI